MHQLPTLIRGLFPCVGDISVYEATCYTGGDVKQIVCWKRFAVQRRHMPDKAMAAVLARLVDIQYSTSSKVCVSWLFSPKVDYLLLIYNSIELN